MSNNSLTNSLIAALLCITAAVMPEKSSAAEPRWFQVELIFFEPVNPIAGGEASSVQKTDDRTTAAGKELSRYRSSSRAFQLLKPSQFSMTSISKKLRRSKQYRILSHIAWRQPTVARARSRAVHVHDKLMQNGQRSSGSNQPLTLNDLPDPLQQSNKRFDGTVTVSLERYLHLSANISYFNQRNGGDYKLEDSRRMRSNEIHYIDHPYFGIIAKITPYQP